MAYSELLVGAHLQFPAGAHTSPTLPAIRRIAPSDLIQSLTRGFGDFSAMPSHAVFLCVIYPLLGVLLISLSLGHSMLPLVFPLAAGFALIGPLAAIGLYELSRRREAGLDTSSTHAFDVLRSPSLGAIVALALLLMAIFLIWLAVAQAIYVANFGYAAPASIRQFVADVFYTSAGRNLIIVGTGVGFLFAALVLIISAVSFPLLLDRDVGAAVALLTSIRVVAANPVTMALWGLIVAAMLVIGSVPFFLGLTLVMPVLGHATWHLYRKAVEPDPNPRPDYPPREKSRRYAADFPAVLFPTFPTRQRSRALDRGEVGMNVKAILDNKNTDVATIAPTAALASAVNLLAERGVGALVVVGAGLRVIGIISEEDIVRMLAERGAAALEQPVGQAMTREVATCNRAEMMSSIMRRMTTGKFRHLPVVEEGQLIGIVSIGDVTRLIRAA